jgi:hypothetical protein
MDGTIHSRLERYDGVGKGECPYKAYLAGTADEKEQKLD